MFKNLAMLNKGKDTIETKISNRMINLFRLIDEKRNRLQDLSTINQFCLQSQEKLMK